MLMLLYDSPTRNGQTSSFAIIRRECNPSKGGGGGRVEVKSEKKKKGRRGKKKTERALVDSLSHRLLVVVHQLVFTTSSRNEKGRRGDPRWNSNFFPASMRRGGRAKEGDVDEGLKNSKVRGIKKRNLITSWNGISSYRLTDIWYFMRNARPNFPRMEFYDSRGNKFSSFPSPPSLSPPPSRCVYVRVRVRSLKKIWLEKSWKAK